MEDTLLRIFKRFLLIIAGSGIVSNAMYIFGLGYYQGYIEAFGFEYALFPITWDDAIIWTYYASRELGVSLIVAIGSNLRVIIMLMPILYLIIRVWMALSEKGDSHQLTVKVSKKSFQKRRKLVNLRRNHKNFYRCIYLPMVWLFTKEQSLIAFFASYFFLFFITLLPLFISVWVFFPTFGKDYGQTIVESYLEDKKGCICDIGDKTWNPCISINLQHLKGYEEDIVPEKVKGLVIIKRGDYIGLYTKDGPLTLTLPKVFYYLNTKTIETTESCDK